MQVVTDFSELWLVQFAQQLAWLPSPSLASRLSGYLVATVPQQSLHLRPGATSPHSLCRTRAWAQSPHSASLPIWAKFCTTGEQERVSEIGSVLQTRCLSAEKVRAWFLLGPRPWAGRLPGLDFLGSRLGRSSDCFTARALPGPQGEVLNCSGRCSGSPLGQALIGGRANMCDCPKDSQTHPTKGLSEVGVPTRLSWRDGGPGCFGQPGLREGCPHAPGLPGAR